MFRVLEATVAYATLICTFYYYYYYYLQKCNVDLSWWLTLATHRMKKPITFYWCVFIISFILDFWFLLIVDFYFFYSFYSKHFLWYLSTDIFKTFPRCGWELQSRMQIKVTVIHSIATTNWQHSRAAVEHCRYVSGTKLAHDRAAARKAQFPVNQHTHT